MPTHLDKAATPQQDSLSQNETSVGQTRKAPEFSLSATPPAMPKPAAQTTAAAAPVDPTSMEGKSNGQKFQAAGEDHTLWVEAVGDQHVIMVASTPVPVHKRLYAWRKVAEKWADSKVKENTLLWIEQGLKRTRDMDEAANIPNEATRNSTRHNLGAQLKEILKKLFFVFELDLRDLGAAAVYRGLHFSKDWQAKRGRSVAQESARGWDAVKAEGTYATAVYELAAKLAQKANVPQTEAHLEAALQIVMQEIQVWKNNTDFLRSDTSPKGKAIDSRRKNLQKGIEANAESDPQKSKQLTADYEKMKTQFSQGNNVFKNQFMAALSHYINNQGTFEASLKAKSDGSYKDGKFDGIPFISTSKEPSEAVKYAQGKLAAEDKKSTEGTVGRVMVYVAPRENILEAGGIDVWEELGNGRLKFTDWRMNENEVTFTGKIPDVFHGGMTPVMGKESVEVNAARAEKEAQRLAAPFGGLNKLPKNKAHD